MANDPSLPDFSTPPIPLAVTAGLPVTIKHGFGRQVAGWLVVWQTAAVSFVVADPKADTSKELTLIPSANASVRLVLL